MTAADRNSIDPKFYKGKARPVTTVGGLIRQLQRLPRSLRIEAEMGDAVRVVVANINTDPVVMIEGADSDY